MYGPAKKGMRLWAHFLLRLVQGFSRASLETRWKMSPISFAAITGRGQKERWWLCRQRNLSRRLKTYASPSLINLPLSSRSGGKALNRQLQNFGRAPWMPRSSARNLRAASATGRPSRLASRARRRQTVVKIDKAKRRNRKCAKEVCHER